MFQSDEMCADTGAITLDKELVPTYAGIESIELYNTTYKVKKFFACSSDWLEEFFRIPMSVEKYRIDRINACVDRMKQEEQRRLQTHSACCTII